MNQHDSLDQMSAETKLQHAGAKHRLGSGIVGALENAITFATPSVEEPPVYSRLGNTTNHSELEAVLASCHDTGDAIAAGSGMSAFALIFFALLRPGDHVIVSEGCYGGTFNFMTKILKPWGVSTTFAKVTDWENHVTKQTKLVLAESITNPFCIPQDLGLAAKIAKEHGLIALCDNTFASPVLCKPLAIGFDLVMESATKYINGHSDVIAGMVAGRKDLIAAMRAPHAYLGTFLPTPQCMQVLRGLRTLEIRMAAHTKAGRHFAEEMGRSKLVEKVYYGAEDHPVAAKYFPSGFGGMVTVRFAKQVNVKKMMRTMQLVSDVPSLGGTESSATMPAFTTNWFMSVEEKKAMHIDEQVVRFSIGLESPKDIVKDVLAAAQACS